MNIEMFDSKKFCGYEQITTFYTDFSIAENFGLNAVRDTFNNAFKQWKNDYKYLTELAMVLNWKLSRWYEDNNELATLYEELWEKADKWACENLKGEALDYYYQTTD